MARLRSFSSVEQEQIHLSYTGGEDTKTRSDRVIVSANGHAVPDFAIIVSPLSSWILFGREFDP